MKTAEEILKEKDNPYEHLANTPSFDHWRIDMSMEDAIEAMEEYANQFKPQWKDAKTSWPSGPCTCLCYFKQGFYSIVYFNRMAWYHENKSDITHWMPLPQPPIT